MMNLPGEVKDLIAMALAEDVGKGDVTSNLLISESDNGRARIEARQELVCCGLEVAAEVYRQVDHRVDFRPVAGDGDTVERMNVMATLQGPLRSILTGERTALNFLQRLCGVATMSQRYFRAAAGRVKVLDSRKTIPGWRFLDKYAVRTGGCANHRMGLYDAILIKDNHIKACGSVGAAVEKAVAAAREGMIVEVEVENLDELSAAVEAGAHVVMLDNFTPAMIRQAADMAAGRVLLEVSGGVTLDVLETVAAASCVDSVSVGALTHSATAADVAMEFL